MNDATTTAAPVTIADHKARVELKFTDTPKGGVRAYRYERGQMRWFPVAFAKAHEMLRSGAAYDNTAYHAAEAVKLDRLNREFRARNAAARNGVTLRIVK